MARRVDVVIRMLQTVPEGKRFIEPLKRIAASTLEGGRQGETPTFNILFTEYRITSKHANNENILRESFNWRYTKEGFEFWNECATVLRLADSRRNGYYGKGT